MHDAYWNQTCKRGTKGCGYAHQNDVPAPVKEVERVSRWQKGKDACRERERMAAEGKCYHCSGRMQELVSVLRMPGIRYFVCAEDAAHTVVIMPETLI